MGGGGRAARLELAMSPNVIAGGSDSGAWRGSCRWSGESLCSCGR